MRLRSPRGRPAQPRKAYVPKATDQKDWLFIPIPPLIEPALYDAAHRQLNENRARARMGTRRPGYLLQGLLSCSECRYAFYGKTTRQRGAGSRLKDFVYYRCSGTDGYRFGGERICNNPPISGEFIEASVWAEVCGLLKNPQRLRAVEESTTIGARASAESRGWQEPRESPSLAVTAREAAARHGETD